MSNRNRFSRRTWIQWSCTAAAMPAVHSLGPLFGSSINEKIRIAAVGVTGRGGENLREVAHEEVTALADCDENLLAKGGAEYPRARRYVDWREMLEREEGKIDAVLVSTPDHNHAIVAATALRMGLPVYCEKPLTHTVHEARVLAELANERNVATQMGTQIHAGDNYRRVVELIRAGVIGDIREVHVWANAVYTGAKFNNQPKPAGLNWDVWLGPAPERPYSSDVHPFQWRKFWEYGNGTLGDFGCHYMDLVQWALELRAPEHVAATGPEVDAVSAPAWCEVHYRFPSRSELPELDLYWYDSGRTPPKLAELKEPILDLHGRPFSTTSGQWFIGSRGTILSNYGQRCVLLDDPAAELVVPQATIPSSIGHHREWLQAIRTGEATTCNFDYAGCLTETVCLGVASYRSGEAFSWDRDQLSTGSAKKAQQYIEKEYRAGWSL